jgi:hypothetical protein
MISSSEAFSIFRKWQQDSSSIELLTGSVQDATTPRPTHQLSRVVDVSEPNEIVLQPWGEGLSGVNYFFSLTTIISPYQRQLLLDC